jgi:hypothetical protein
MSKQNAKTKDSKLRLRSQRKSEHTQKRSGEFTAQPLRMAVYEEREIDGRTVQVRVVKEATMQPRF